MKPCGYCGSTSFSPFLSGVTDRLHQSSDTYSFLACNACGSSWLDPCPSPEELESAYPEVYGLGKGGAANSSLAHILQSLELKLWLGPVYKRNARLLSRYFGSNGELLDIGCGTGYQTACLREEGFSVTGLDFAPGSAEWMREKHGIDALECSVSSLREALAGRQFDVITAFHVVEHMTDPDAFLAAVLEQLRPGGAVFFSAPLAGSLQARLFGRQWGAYREAPRHVSLPSRRGLLELFARHGLSDIEARSDHVFYVAGSALVSLVSSLTMTSSYGGSSAVLAAVKRSIGAGLAMCYLPVACVETLTDACSLGLFFGSRSGAR